MTTRVVTFGAAACTAPRHWRRRAVPASRHTSTERASAVLPLIPSHPISTELSSWPEVRRTENPRWLLCGRNSFRTRGSSPRKLLTNHEHVARPTDIRLITVDAYFRPAAELRAPIAPQEYSM